MRLRHAPAEQCHRLLQPGDVRRTMPTGAAFVGYWICCPACGRCYPYLDSHVGFSESPEWVRTPWRGWVSRDGCGDPDELVDRVVTHTAVLSAREVMTCCGCAGKMAIRENEIATVGPTLAP